LGWSDESAGGETLAGDEGDAPIEVSFKDLGFKGAVKVRDVWNGKDLGAMEDYTAEVPGHGVVLLRVK
jgi:hypothetical protein